MAALLTNSLVAEEPFSHSDFERAILRAVERIPELHEAFRIAKERGVDLLLYGGTTRSLGFYVRKQLLEKGQAFFAETATIPLEEVVGPYSDLDLIVRGNKEVADRIQQHLRSQFPEGERFYRWEVRTEDYLKEPWQITQGYEPISKILLGKDGFAELDWRTAAFGRSLNEQGIREILSGEISYVRNPRYGESEPYRRGEHHELLEVMRYLRFLHEFEGVKPASGSIETVRAVLEEAKRSKELPGMLSGQLLKSRFETNLRKLQYTPLDSVQLMRDIEGLGLADLVRSLGYQEELRVPLADAANPSEERGEKLGRAVVVYHGTKDYKKAWSIHRGGPYISTHAHPQGFYTATNPHTAQGYANGDGDFVLRVTLSPDARIGEDVLYESDTQVLVIRTKRAIAQIEKPQTLTEIKGKLLGLLSQRQEQNTLWRQQVLDLLEEIGGRAEQGSYDALQVVATLALPEELQGWQLDSLDRLLRSQRLPGGRLASDAALAKVHPAALRRLLDRALNLPAGPVRTSLLSGFALNPALAEFPQDVLEPFLKFVRRTKSHRTQEEVLRQLAFNPSLSQLPQEISIPLIRQMLRFETLRTYPSLLQTLTQNPSFADWPGDIRSQLLDAVSKIEHPWVRWQTLAELLGKPFLPRLPPENLAQIFAAMEAFQDRSLTRGLLEMLAKKKVFAELSAEIRDRFLKAAFELTDPFERAKVFIFLMEHQTLESFLPVELKQIAESAAQWDEWYRKNLTGAIARNPSFQSAEKSREAAERWLREKSTSREPVGASESVGKARSVQTQPLALGIAPADPPDQEKNLERGMLRAVERIPELDEAFRLAGQENVKLLLYGGTTRSLGFYVKKQLQEKGEAFLRETTPILLEEVVGPYSDLDLIVRASGEVAQRIQETLRSQFPEGERFYRWEIRPESYLKEPWQITQGYEPISKVLLGKDGFTELDWRHEAFGKSLTHLGIEEIVSGQISYARNPRYKESQPFRRGEHHEILEAMRFLRFLSEFEAVRPANGSLEVVKAILDEARQSTEIRTFLRKDLFENRFEMNLQKLLYTSRDNVKLAELLEEIGFLGLLKDLGLGKERRIPLAQDDGAPREGFPRLGKPLAVYHGTKGFKEASSIYRGGFYITTYSNPKGVFVTTDPAHAKHYAQENVDFILKITLSPDAVVGQDLVFSKNSEDVLILKTRKAIQGIEKPRSSVEIRGRLFGALARWRQNQTEELKKEFLGYAEEVTRRAQAHDLPHRRLEALSHLMDLVPALTEVDPTQGRSLEAIVRERLAKEWRRKNFDRFDNANERVWAHKFQALLGKLPLSKQDLTRILQSKTIPLENKVLVWQPFDEGRLPGVDAQSTREIATELLRAYLEDSARRGSPNLYAEFPLPRVLDSADPSVVKDQQFVKTLQAFIESSNVNLYEKLVVLKQILPRILQEYPVDRPQSQLIADFYQTAARNYFEVLSIPTPKLCNRDSRLALSDLREQFVANFPAQILLTLERERVLEILKSSGEASVIKLGILSTLRQDPTALSPGDPELLTLAEKQTRSALFKPFTISRRGEGYHIGGSYRLEKQLRRAITSLGLDKLLGDYRGEIQAILKDPRTPGRNKFHLLEYLVEAAGKSPSPQRALERLAEALTVGPDAPPLQLIGRQEVIKEIKDAQGGYRFREVKKAETVPTALRSLATLVLLENFLHYGSPASNHSDKDPSAEAKLARTLGASRVIEPEWREIVNLLTDPRLDLRMRLRVPYALSFMKPPGNSAQSYAHRLYQEGAGRELLFEGLFSEHDVTRQYEAGALLRRMGPELVYRDQPKKTVQALAQKWANGSFRSGFDGWLEVAAKAYKALPEPEKNDFLRQSLRFPKFRSLARDILDPAQKAFSADYVREWAPRLWSVLLEEDPAFSRTLAETLRKPVAEFSLKDKIRMIDLLALAKAERHSLSTETLLASQEVKNVLQEGKTRGSGLGKMALRIETQLSNEMRSPSSELRDAQHPAAPQTQSLAIAVSGNLTIDRANLERGMVSAIQRIPELQEAFRLAQKEGAEIFLYGGTTRSLGFYVKKQLQEKGQGFFAEKSPIPLEEVVGPYSDLDLIVRGPQEQAAKIEQTLRSRFPEGERFYRWEIRTEDYLNEPWQITQGYEPISKVLLGKDGFREFEWREQAFGKSLTQRGIQEILSGEVTYRRNPRYRESETYQRGEHHEILEAMRYLRFLHEFEDVRPTSESLQAVKAVVAETGQTNELSMLLGKELFRHRLEINLQKLLYTSLDNTRLIRDLEAVGLLRVLRRFDVAGKLRVPLPKEAAPSTESEQTLGRRWEVYHGTKGYKQAWSIYRGGFFMTEYSHPQGVFASPLRDVARGYANGNEDFILKLVLSPEARMGRDVKILDSNMVLILSGRAIEKVEKPLTSIELKGELLGLAALREKADPSWVQRGRANLDELRRRVLQGNTEALRALATVSLPPELANDQRAFVEQLFLSRTTRDLVDLLLRESSLVPSYLAEPLIHKLRTLEPGDFDRLLVREFSIVPGAPFEKIVRRLVDIGRTGNGDMLGAVRELVDEPTVSSTLRTILSKELTARPTEAPPSDPYVAVMLSGLVANPALAKLPEGLLRDFLKTAAPPEDAQGGYRFAFVLSSNPALHEFPSGILQEVIETASALSDPTRKAGFFENFVKPTSLSKLPVETLQAVMRGVSGVRSSRVRSTLFALVNRGNGFSMSAYAWLAVTPQIALLPEKTLLDFVRSAKHLSSDERAVLVDSMLRNDALAQFPERVLQELIRASRGLKLPPVWRSHPLEGLVQYRSFLDLPASALKELSKATRNLPNSESRASVLRALAREDRLPLFPKDALESLVKATRSLKDSGHAVLTLKGFFRDPSLPQLPVPMAKEFLEQTLELKSPQVRAEILGELLMNPSLRQFPQPFLEKVRTGIADLAKVSPEWRGWAFQDFARNVSLAEAPSALLRDLLEATNTDTGVRDRVLYAISENRSFPYRPVTFDNVSKWLSDEIESSLSVSGDDRRRQRIQGQELALAAVDLQVERSTLEKAMLKAVDRIPELREAFRVAQKEGADLLLYGGTTRSLGFYVKRQLERKGEAFLRETAPILLEDVVGPYSDLDLIVRGPPEAASRIQRTMRTEFPEGERFYRWEVRTEDYLKEPWQITQGYEPISRILFGKDGFVEAEWRERAFGRSLTTQGTAEMLSGEISYVRNPRYRESEPFQRGEHHELLEVMRYVRFLQEFEGVKPTQESLRAVRAIVQDPTTSQEVRNFLGMPVFKNRFEVNLRKLQYSSLDNIPMTRGLEQLGLADLIRGLGFGNDLRVPLAEGVRSERSTGEKLGQPLVVYHGTKGYKEAWSIHRGGPFITTHREPQGLYVSTNPKVAESYARGEADFVLEMTLSPEARLDEDVIRTTDPSVLVVKTRKAIERIEKPQTLVEVKANFLRAISDKTKSQKEMVREYLRELESRARQGSYKAFEVLLALSLPEDLRPLKEQTLGRVLHEFGVADFGRFAGDGLLKNAPPDVLQTVIKHLPRIKDPQVAISLASTASLDQLRANDLREMLNGSLELTRTLIGDRHRFLEALGANPAMSKFPPAVLHELWKTVAESPIPSYRTAFLVGLSKNESLAWFPRDFLTNAAMALRQVQFERRTIFDRLLGNPSLLDLSPDLLEAFADAADPIRESRVRQWIDFRLKVKLAREAEPARDAPGTPVRQTQERSLAALVEAAHTNDPEIRTLERASWDVIHRIPEFQDLFLEAKDLGIESVYLYGGSSRNVVFQAKRELVGAARRSAPAADSWLRLEDVVGPYSDLDVMIQGTEEQARRLQERMEAQYPGGERFYRWEVRNEDYLKEPWQITQGYESISKILLGKDGFVELPWREQAFGKSLTDQGVKEILSGEISYARSPRYKESEPYRRKEHHEILEAMRYLRFLHEFEGVRPAAGSLESVQAILKEVLEDRTELQKLLASQTFRNRFEMNLRKLQYTSTDNAELAKTFDAAGMSDALRQLGFAEELRVPLPRRAPSPRTEGERLGKRLTVYHGTRGYKQAWSIHKGGFFITTYNKNKGVYVSTDPAIARSYANGESDFVLKITLSPDARIGTDLVWSTDKIAVIKTKDAIEKIERPLTVVELKGQLLRFLASGNKGGELGRQEVQEVLDEFNRRVDQGSFEALKAIASLRLPEEFRYFRDELLRRIPEPEHFPDIDFPLLAEDPEFTRSPLDLQRAVLKRLQLEPFDLRFLADNPLLGRFPAVFLREFLSKTAKLNGEGEVLEALANNPSIENAPPEIQAELLKVIRNTKDLDAKTLALAWLAANPAVRGFPRPVFENFLNQIKESSIGGDRASFAHNLARNPSLTELPAKVLDDLMRAVRTRGSKELRTAVVEGFARNPRLADLPPELVGEVVEQAGRLKDSYERLRILETFAQNPSFPSLPARVHRQFLKAGQKPREKYILRALAENPSFPGPRQTTAALRWLREQSAAAEKVSAPAPRAGRKVIQGQSLTAPLIELEAMLSARPVPQNLGWTLVFGGDGAREGYQGRQAPSPEQIERGREIAQSVTPPRPQGLKGHSKQFARGMGTWLAALPIADMGTALIQGRAGEIPAQLAAMAQPESLAMLGLNYGSFALAAESVQYPMTRLASQAANRAAAQALARAGGAGLEKAAAEMAAKKAAAQAFKNIARFAGPAGFFAGSAVADMVMSGGHLDLERWVVNGVAFLGVHAALSATVAPLLIAGLGLSATGIGATVGAPILILAGTMIAVSAIEMAYDYFRAHPEVLVNAGKWVADGFKDAGNAIAGGFKEAGSRMWSGLKKMKFW